LAKQSGSLPIERGRPVKKTKTSNGLLEWKKWLHEELTPPYSDAVSLNPDLKRVLEAFLELATFVSQAHS
jgi:hypothetical protein